MNQSGPRGSSARGVGSAHGGGARLPQAIRPAAVAIGRCRASQPQRSGLRIGPAAQGPLAGKQALALAAMAESGGGGVPRRPPSVPALPPTRQDRKSRVEL